MNLYQHSGKLGFAPILLPVAGIPILLILACIYAYINVYNPIGGYVTFLIILGYAFACGFAIALLLKFGKCRSNLFGYGAGLIGSLLSLHFAWAFFLYALLHRFEVAEIGILDIFLNPFGMWNLISEINATGWFTIKGGTPSGIFLWILWGIEALTILLVTFFMSGFAINDEMFCEKCSSWANVTETKFLKLPKEFENKKASDINALTLNNLEPLENSLTRPALQAELIKCQTCTTCAGWKYKIVSVEIDKDGNEKDKHDDISGIVMA